MRLIDSHCHLNYEGLVERQDCPDDARGARGGRLRNPFLKVYEIDIARGGQAFSHMRHDSHLKMLVSGSSRRAMSPRDRSGKSRFSYGYFRVTGCGWTKC